MEKEKERQTRRMIMGETPMSDQTRRDREEERTGSHEWEGESERGGANHGQREQVWARRIGALSPCGVSQAVRRPQLTSEVTSFRVCFLLKLVVAPGLPTCARWRSGVISPFSTDIAVMHESRHISSVKDSVVGPARAAQVPVMFLSACL